MFHQTKPTWTPSLLVPDRLVYIGYYYLKKAHEDFIILDAANEVGDSWRNRWDSLKLFTPNWANALPGYPFPGNKISHASKDEVADFLASYASKFDLPVLTQTRVISLVKGNEIYHLKTNRGVFTCKNIVVANGSYAIPKIPAFANKLHPDIVQIHSSDYRRAADLPPGDILVVGAGTSGVQIAIDAARIDAARIDAASPHRKIYIAGNPPRKIPSFILKYFGKAFVWAMNNIVTINTKPGRKAAYAIKTKHVAAPLINISIRDAERAGVKHISRIKDVVNQYPELEDGTTLKVSTIIWCTGYKGDFSWIEMNDVTGDDGHPLSYRGISTKYKGLYFAGMPFQYSLTSAWINGVGRDAKYITDHIRVTRFGR